jgi:hypothetical protein
VDRPPPRYCGFGVPECFDLGSCGDLLWRSQISQLSECLLVSSSTGTVRASVGSGQGVDRGGASVGWVVGVELACVGECEAGLLQRAAGCVVGGLWCGHDHVDVGIAGEDVGGVVGDGGGSDALSDVAGLADEIVDAGCCGDADGVVPVAVVGVPVALDDADRLSLELITLRSGPSPAGRVPDPMPLR